jgi:hypothetical protein
MLGNLTLSTTDERAAQLVGWSSNWLKAEAGFVDAVRGLQVGSRPRPSSCVPVGLLDWPGGALHGTQVECLLYAQGTCWKSVY